MELNTSKKGKRYDYIEIGTSDFETLVQKYNDEMIGLSIDPLQIYLDNLPDKKNNTKVNVAISNDNFKTKVYYIEPNKIYEHGLPDGFRGCNSIEKKHPTVSKWLDETNLSHLLLEKEIECISFQELVDRYDISEVDYLKIDTEGYDFVIIKSMLKTNIRPKKITFEANSLYSYDDIVDIVNILQQNGYDIWYKDKENISMKFKETIEDDDITFIVPTIGRKTLDRSIGSILNQTNPNWKCTIVFDGIPIIEKINYKDEEYSLVDDTRFKFIRIDKTGNLNDSSYKSGGQAGLVRNAGILASKSKWIAFLDDDDTISANYVELLRKKYNNYDVVIWRMHYTSDLILPGLKSNEIFPSNVGISFCYQTKFENILFNQNDGIEDFYFLENLLNKTDDYIITSEVMYNVGH